MSIRPNFAQAILNGSKMVEFRKRRLAPDVEVVLIYETAPTQRIVGRFSVKRTVEGAPRDLWRRYAKVGGITESGLLAYFGSALAGYALEIGIVEMFQQPLRLVDLDPVPAIPQSFSYIGGESLVSATGLTTESGQLGALEHVY